jgi:hypothetical protein
MATRFHGWPQEAYAVLLQLDGEPSRQARERPSGGQKQCAVVRVARNVEIGFRFNLDGLDPAGR